MRGVYLEFLPWSHVAVCAQKFSEYKCKLLALSLVAP